jgi:hypothetical protein
MIKTKWWLHFVGGFYLLLVAGSFWVMFINPRLFGDMFPYATDETAARAFSDAWLIFALAACRRDPVGEKPRRQTHHKNGKKTIENHGYLRSW